MIGPQVPSDPPRPKRWWLAAVAFAALLLVPSPVLSNHVQTGSAGSGSIGVQFDHDGDNEWWVEVLTKPAAGDSVNVVEARAEHGTTTNTMHAVGTSNGWTKWAPNQAFRIPPGDRVIFRAYMTDGATGQVGFVESCPFTHPVGVEECGSPLPPQDWQVRLMGNAGVSSGSGDMAVGDADNDGRRDVTQATRNGIFNFEWTGTAWVRQQIGSRSATYAVAVGDGNGDGRSEIYAMSNSDLVRYDFVGGAWVETLVTSFAEPFPDDMTIGDIDGIPGPELYVGMADGTSSAVHKVRLDAAGGLVESQLILLQQGHLESLWIGDGDRDGSFELYIGHGTAHAAKASRLRHTSSGWEFTTIDQGGSNYGEKHVVAGDGDRDGKPEIYSITDQGEFRRASFSPATGWNIQTPYSSLPSGSAPAIAPSGLFLGDGDGDGSDELYVTTWYGQLIQVRWDGAFWQVTEVARPTDGSGENGNAALTVVGDGDGDGRREAYLSISYSTGIPYDEGHTEVYQVGVPRASTSFDATFTGVRGNEWWIQANVAAAGGTLSKVDVRLNGGAWQPLTKQSWGGWAASYHAVQGTVVQFRATSTTGATDLSDCYQWIPPSNTDATKVACGSTPPPPPPPPPPPGFDATFSSVKGNDWWVEAKVTANQAIAKVEARVNCGTAWQTLTLQSWGSYAKSFNVPSGSKVDFRATSTTGAVDYSAGYIWPQATPTAGCP
ncbi:MAG: hypothetical protein QOD77_123 [Thermoplasmata archaeon]|jgi:hypothetical protein|nr:hypothetical protein [Thermoplasmata archaeon]